MVHRPVRRPNRNPGDLRAAPGSMRLAAGARIGQSDRSRVGEKAEARHREIGQVRLLPAPSRPLSRLREQGNSSTIQSTSSPLDTAARPRSGLFFVTIQPVRPEPPVKRAIAFI